ncbi:MAG TPA: hypothetical protein V6D09_26455 [Leptolyngbyaceae cyanobacterium]
MTLENPNQLENLSLSVTAGLDAFNQIVNLQELLEISLELVTTSPEKRQSRTELLTICYLHQVKPFLEELSQEFKEMRQEIDQAKTSQKTS